MAEWIQPQGAASRRCSMVAFGLGTCSLAAMQRYGPGDARQKSWMAGAALAATTAAVVVPRLLWAQRVKLRSSSADAPSEQSLPYTAQVVVCGQRELVVVATMHVAPSSPEDVRKTIEIARPSCVLIELDRQRLARFAPAKNKQVQKSDLQELSVHLDGAEKVAKTFHAVRATWNGLQAGKTISGPLVSRAKSVPGAIWVIEQNPERVCRDMLAARRAGAQAVILLAPNRERFLRRVEVRWNVVELLAAASVLQRSAFELPCLLLPYDDSMELCKLSNGAEARPHVSFDIRAEDNPRVQPRLPLSVARQSLVLILSGVWILYGGLQLAGVKVGEEFRVALLSAKSLGVPCKCCDLTLDELGAEIRKAIKPTPRNLYLACKHWLTAPLWILQLVFPANSDVDVLGCALLQFSSLPPRSWVALLTAGVAASAVLNSVLAAPGKALALSVSLDATRTAKLIERLTFFLTVYLIPRVTEAMLNSRDEAMYRGVVAAFNDQPTTDAGDLASPQRVVLVCGAAHSNGILRRARDRGLGGEGNGV